MNRHHLPKGAKAPIIIVRRDKTHIETSLFLSPEGGGSVYLITITIIRIQLHFDKVKIAYKYITPELLHNSFLIIYDSFMGLVRQPMVS